jgi:Cu-Zn family superoxide dismutase
MKKIPLITAALALVFSAYSPIVISKDYLNGHDVVVIDIHAIDTNIDTSGIGDKIGSIEVKDTPLGLALNINVSELTFGPHGFHVHQNPDCGFKERDGQIVAGLAAGGHFDPTSSNTHLGPDGEGHLGDLPLIRANEQGVANMTLIASRLKLKDIINRSFIIHEFGDNYQDTPKPLGGGGPRIACGVITTN